MKAILYAVSFLPSIQLSSKGRNIYVKYYWFIDHSSHCRFAHQQ